MVGQSRAQPAHHPSVVLTNEENDTVFRLLGPRCQAQASGVVQVYGTEHPNHNYWLKMMTGVATFTKDSNRKSFYIQVYEIVEGVRTFEQEVYREFEYHDSRDFFHQFESDDRMIGLNFADDTDAANFLRAVSSLLMNRRRKREERKRQAMQQQQQRLCAGTGQQQQKQQQQQQQQQHIQQTQQNHKTMQPTHKEKRFLGMGTKRDKKKYSKTMIGLPTDFKHVSHVGIGKNTPASFNVDEELQDLLMAVGLDQKKLSDDDTREFVFDYIETHGGLEEFRKASRKYSKRNEGDHSVNGGGQHPGSYGGRAAPPPPLSTNPSPSVHSALPPPPTPARTPHPTPEAAKKAMPRTPPPRSGQGVRSAGDEVPIPPPPKYLVPVPPPPAKSVHPPSQQPLSKDSVSSPLTSSPKGGTPPSHPPVSKGGVLHPSPPTMSRGDLPPTLPLSSTGGISYPVPPPGTRNMSPPSSPMSRYFVPPPPSVAKVVPPLPPPPPQMAPPPPPPPPPSLSLSRLVPPPPPPPLPTGGVLRHPSDGNQGAPADPRSALLDQIRSGVRPLKVAPPAARNSAPLDNRSQLLEDIRCGVKLHKVDASDADVKTEESPRLEGLALGLLCALQERAKFIQSNDDSDDTLDDEDEEEWDDE